MSKLFTYSAELHLGSTLGWVDITSDVRGSVSITRGRTSEGIRADPGQCTLRLDNRSGDYSPRNPAGAYYGLLGRNTPLRVGTGLAVDAFGRTASSGWGTADSGQAWTVSGSSAADFSVSSGLARHAQPLKNIVRISRLGEDWRDVEQVTEASIPAVALGASVVVGHVARYSTTSGDYYWLRMEFNPAGTMTAKISRNAGGDIAVSANIPGMTYTAGQSWTFRSSVSGSHLAVKFWPTGTAEPVDWMLTATDRTLTTGDAGIATWAVLGNTNTTEVRFDNYQALVRRFYGEVSTWPPGWDLKGTDRFVDVEAAGILRRLGQGEQPEWSPMRRTIAAASPLAYWPLEDGTDTGQGGSHLPGAVAMSVTGAAPFDDLESWTARNGYAVAYGTAALADVSQGATLSGFVPADVTAATVSGWTVTVSCDFAVGSDLLADFVLCEVETPGGSFVRWRLLLLAATFDVQLVAYDSSGTGTVVFTDTAPFSGLVPHNLAVWQNGGNISAGYIWDSVIGYEASGSVAGTLAGVTQVTINPTSATAAVPVPVGHVALWAGHDLDVVDFHDGPVIMALFSHAWTNINSASAAATGEAAATRLSRLCAEQGIPFDEVPTDPDPVHMGPQPIGQLAGLLDECAEADGGYLHESRDTLGLAFRPRESLYNQTPVSIAYVGQLAPPFAPDPTADDVRNDVTVKRTNGSSARVVETTGRLAAVTPPDGVGVYQTSVELNLADDGKLADQAGWRVHLGTVDADRYPALSVQFAAPGWQADPAGMAAVLAVDTGDVLEVTGMPTWAAGDARTLVLGYTETISEYLWSITFAGVPAQPWDVAELEGDARVAMDGGTLGAAVTASATSLQLASTAWGGLWTTNPLDFPLDLRVGEERVTVSAISGTSSPQTATVSARAVNGVSAAWAAGTEVDVWLPAVVAL